MKKLIIIFCVLHFLSCQKSKNTVVEQPSLGTTTTSSARGMIAAKINDRAWKSAAKTTADTNTYLAAINDGNLQIKTFGSFVDSSGVISEDQLGIYIGGVADTGTFLLSFTNYIVYNQLSATPQYFSTQSSNIGIVHITNLTDTTISGTFECRVDNTSGSGLVSIKEGTFTDVPLQ
jgi:hypothetical protein